MAIGGFNWRLHSYRGIIRVDFLAVAVHRRARLIIKQTEAVIRCEPEHTDEAPRRLQLDNEWTTHEFTNKLK